MAATTSEDLGLTVLRLKALSDPNRLRILDRLRSGERCVCDLTDALDAGQSLLSFHLKSLKDAGLVTDRREGRWAYYTLNAEALREVESFVGSLSTRVPGARWTPVCCP
jgi:ArsR family transcriptional regulator